MASTTLYRPVGLKEFELVKQSDWKVFPPRLSHQPIFYPVTNVEYAIQIARDWNTKDVQSDYVGFVMVFEIDSEFLSQYEKKTVGSSIHTEYWIPAEDLPNFNQKLSGSIRMHSVYYGEEYTGLKDYEKYAKSSCDSA